MTDKIYIEVVNQKAFINYLIENILPILQEILATQSPPPNSLLTTKEMYSHLNIGRSTFLKLLSQDIIPGIRIGNQWRFDPEEVVQAFKSYNVKPDKTNEDV